MAKTAGEQFAVLPVSNKVAVGALLLMVVAALYYALLHTSMDEELEATRNQQVVLQQELDSAQALKRQFIALREELEARKTRDEENLRVLPDGSEIASVLQDLNRLAELSGLDIRSVQPRPEAEAEFYMRIPVNLQVAGRYHQLAKFFYNVSRLQRAINIENISIELKATAKAGVQADQADEIILSVQVLATTFRRKPTAEPS